jgi:transcriptional regulator of acetoin/glycerol metabolism
MNYPWPGNVRELEHVIEHAFIICHGHVITIDDLPVEFRELGKPGKASALGNRKPFAQEAQEIINALTKARWNKTKAAHLLGINRRTLYRKLDQLHINPDA